MYCVEYEIVSPGTERHGSKGYMNVSEVIDDRSRIISPTPHGTRKVDWDDNCLKIEAKLELNMIPLIRFQLIPALALAEPANKYNYICVLGAGPVGVSTIFEAKRRNLGRVDLYTRRINFIKQYENYFDKAVNFLEYGKYDCFIDCTGDSLIIENTLRKMRPCSALYLVGTPRRKPKADLLHVHRNNIKIFGGHELKDKDRELRQKLINEIQNWHLHKGTDISNMVKIHHANVDLRAICGHKHIEPFNMISIINI